MTALLKLKGVKALAFASVIVLIGTVASAQDKSDWPDSFSVGTASQ
ncbi:C4-dicarboxylate ABC transporter substrate-binding protein, partial [Synechococcus sp. MU1644]|nr:C4-dicarboxylate ABC transporter substrate-binding protein [Synechococcus sp. MU1644]